MARAKRTERADARRRYRVATDGAPDDAVVDSATIPAAAVPRDQRDRRPSGSAKDWRKGCPPNKSAIRPNAGDVVEPNTFPPT